jgi:hypothetical protein
MGDLLGEDDALVSIHILHRCLEIRLDRKAALFSHLKSRWQDLFGIKLKCQKVMKEE